MSEGTKKVDQTEQEPKTTELSERDLDQVAGGGFDYQPLPHDTPTIKHMDETGPPLAPLKL